jgi:AraC-like DNA-binding protein
MPLNVPVAPIKGPAGFLNVKTGPARIVSSAAHQWQGTLALDIVGEPTGECRHDHSVFTLQLWAQPLLLRPLRGSGGWRTVAPGAHLWLPGEQQYFEWRQGSRTRIVLIRPERVEQMLERPYEKTNLERWCGLDFADPFVQRIISAISEDIGSGCPAGALVGDSLTTALVGYLDAGPRKERNDARARGPSRHDFARMLRFIEDNLADTLRMTDLAREAGCSPKQLSRAFRELRGVLPHQYVIERRVERAKSLIDRDRLSLAEVAAAAGFADQSQMTKIFQRLLSMTPGQLRKRQRN